MLTNTFTLKGYFDRTADAAPLAVYRIAFGALMAFSMLRFYLNGWIQKLYIEPDFFFSYYGFEWVQPLGGWTYLIFIICGVSAVFVMIGYYYRAATAVFFLSFTYIELMDKTTYLNHYYFVSLVAFLLMFLPAHTAYSVDATRKPHLGNRLVPRWTIDALKLMIGIVYFYAGLAKLNSDWLLNAMPLHIWLTAQFDLPLLGALLQNEWSHYAFSWLGTLYDLTIPFLLLWKHTRPAAFLLLVIFHLLTGLLFPIGMFPYIMIAGSLIFFDAQVHRKMLRWIGKITRIKWPALSSGVYRFPRQIIRKGVMPLFAVFFVLQLTLPFRYLLYPGELFWTGQGFRFSWRVMLIEKRGYAQFKVVNPATGDQFYVDNDDYLTPFQEKQMSFQADFILEFAHYLENIYRQKGINDPRIYVESYASLNGRGSQRYIDPNVDLTTIERSLKPKQWILPLGDAIQGL
ncbi:MAG: HTTM domain-containing protein [Candidatus Halalkalibacterium sp. M3_1C_030]